MYIMKLDPKANLNQHGKGSMMKRLLLTGSNSYIGKSFTDWANRKGRKYEIDTLNLRDDSWDRSSFAGFDSIIHLAAIVHKKVKDKSEYFKINRDLAYRVALKAKEDAVPHFVFMSTMGVYGMTTGNITGNTNPSPKTPYAQSKYQAECLISELQDDTFKVAIIRPPIVYGEGCKGNYPKLSKLILATPLFPDITNCRSMIYIENLCEFMALIVDKGLPGLFHPQNKEYVRIVDLARLIAEVNGKQLSFTKVFNPLLQFLSN